MSQRDYSAGTKAALAALSRGICYYPGCDAKLVIVREDGEAYIDYDIAHIYDANPGNRYREDMTDAERKAFANLILLCGPHHEEVDKRHPENFSAGLLLQWKRDKESTYGDTAELAALSEGQLAAALVSTAINISNSTLISQGGQEPGAGGAGGWAMGPNARGGRGGDGGDQVSG
ncbi:MAG: hypothetical protein JO246_07590 [Frankiaceae bacterium]|nr:hypothetical protein [Frankiaceae bacterium]